MLEYITKFDVINFFLLSVYIDACMQCFYKLFMQVI